MSNSKHTKQNLPTIEDVMEQLLEIQVKTNWEMLVAALAELVQSNLTDPIMPPGKAEADILDRLLIDLRQAVPVARRLDAVSKVM